MKKLIRFIATLSCIFGLVGCTTSERIEKPTADDNKAELLDDAPMSSEIATKTPSFLLGTTFQYGDVQYDMTARFASINAINACLEVGAYIVVECHVNPKNAVYSIFNTETETFETELFGTHLIWLNDDIYTAVYAFWGDVLAYDGTVLASYTLGDSDFIKSLSYSDDNSKIAVEIHSDIADTRTETIDMDMFLRFDDSPQLMGLGSVAPFLDEPYETQNIDYSNTYGTGDDYWVDYCYDGLTARCYFSADSNTTTIFFQITTTRSDVKTSRGIGVGDSRDAVLTAYPDCKDETYWGYEGDYLWYNNAGQEYGASLIFYFENDEVISLEVVNMFD